MASLTAQDVAKYFLAQIDDESGDTISHLKLQKLVYYAQGYHLALTGKPLFRDIIRAWAHGPVVRSVYNSYSKYGSKAIPRPKRVDFSRYSPEQRGLLDEGHMDRLSATSSKVDSASSMYRYQTSGFQNSRRSKAPMMTIRSAIPARSRSLRGMDTRPCRSSRASAAWDRVPRKNFLTFCSVWDNSIILWAICAHVVSTAGLP